MNKSILAKSVLLLALGSFVPTQAEAMRANVHRGGGAHVNRNMHVNRNVNVNRNVHVNRNVNVNRNVRVNGYHGGVYHAGAWARPYRLAPGGAVAAGAAIGFVSAASAAAWAGAPPQPGLCWYYTDPSQRNGFWDNCR
jgi:hypothetical protein